MENEITITFHIPQGIIDRANDLAAEHKLTESYVNTLTLLLGCRIMRSSL